MADRVGGEAAAGRPVDGTARPRRHRLGRLLLFAAALIAGLALAGGPARAAAAPAGTPPPATPPPATPPPAGHGAAASLAVPVPPAGVEAAGEGRARLSRLEVPAAGRQQAVLTVERFGRYSLRAASRQGTAVRVIDRMAGELGAAGEAGHENGRLDLFLDRGDYLVVAESHEHGEGATKLSVEPFRDARPAANAAPQLVERKLLTESLGDLRQLSYWLRLTDRRAVRLEAAGRNLADLRLWRDGSWLEDVEPSCAAIQPIVGQPLLRCEIATTLGAGLYLVAAYGGPSQPWAEDAAEHPLYLRWGYPRLAEAGRRRYQVSPFGEDRYELPDEVNYVRIELPQAVPAQLAAGWAEAGQLLSNLAGSGVTAEVKKNSVPPVAAVRVPSKPAASGEHAARGGAGTAPDEGARGAEPDIENQEGRGSASGTPEGGDAAGATGDDGAAGESDAMSHAGAEAAAAGGEGAAGDESAAADTASEAAPGGAMPEDSGGGGGANVADTDTGAGAAGAAEAGGEEKAAVAADETAAATPQAVPQAPEEEAPAAEAGGETGGEGTERAPDESAAAGAAAPAGPRLWVTVRGTPGQPYVLQQFQQLQVYGIEGSGRFWISTVASGDPNDSVDATAVLTSRPVDDSERERLEKSAAIPIDGQHAWARRFNLLDHLELFLDVGEKGLYQVVAAGGAAFRIEPFLTSRPADYKAPEFAPSGSRWNLDPGIYVLTALPQRHGGIVTLGVRPVGKFGKLLSEARATPAGRDPVRASARLAPTLLDTARRYTLYLNRQPGVEAGIVLRRWPVDLAQPLPVTQRPGEPLALDFTTAAAGTLRAETEDGQLLEAAVDGGAWQTAPAVPPGDHQLQIRQPADAAPRTVSYSLWVEPLELAAATALPPLPAAALAALPRFPVLRPGSPRYLDLARGADATFLVQADEPALYALQTTGVLATGAALRTRTVTSLAAGNANGVGRNALVRQYLRQGDFQATVTAQGLTQGHLGVELQRTTLLDGGELRLGAPARITLPAGQGVVYRFTIAEADDYRLLAMGLGFVYACRLEDADGWPIAPPNLAADISRRLQPGSYRLVLLPQPIAGRAVTLLSRRQEAPHFKGHGPHSLPLDTTVEHLWREPETATGGEPEAQRPPDVWRFELPAAAATTITLDAEMQGTLARLDTDSAELGQVPPGRRLSLELAAGRYQLAVVCSRRNSLVRYRVRVATAELLDGQEPLLTAPVTLPVSVGGSGLVEISSYSAGDVRARLYAADGSLVADEDDRPDDWNFLISEPLPAGRYRLEIEPVGRRSAKLRLAMRTAAEVADRPLALPYRGDLQLAGDVHLLPLTLPRKADLLLLAARSQENLGLGLEVREGDGWRLLGTSTGREPRLELPLPLASPAPLAAYRVRLWSLERRGTPVRLAVAAVTAPRISEGRLAKGAALPQVPGLEPPLAPLAAAVVELAHPGLVRLQLGDAAAGWRGGAVPGQALAPLASAGSITLAGLRDGGGRIWLVTAEAGAARVRGERLALAPGLDHAIGFQLPAPAAVASCDLARGPAGSHGAGPVLAMVTALAGQPAVQVADAGNTADTANTANAGGLGARPAATLAIGSRSAVSVALSPRQPAALVWDGELAGAPPATVATRPGPLGPLSETPPDLRLAQLTFPPPQPQPAPWGVSGGTLAGLEARQFDLPAGPKKIRLSLGAAQVAVLSDGDAVTSTHWQGGAPFEELLDGSANRLTLLHTAAGTDPFTFELLPRAAGEGELALDAAAPFVRVFDRAGTLRLRLPGLAAAAAAGDGGARQYLESGIRRYRVWSDPPAAAADAALLDGAGGVRRGAEVAGAAGGYLLIQHGPGVVMAWAAGLLEPGETMPAAAGSWQAPLAAPAQAVTPPATVALAGRFMHLAIASREPVVLHVRAASPALTLLARAGGETAAVHPGGVRLDAYLAAGGAQLGLSALGEGELGGFAELTTTPVLPTGEGRGPEILLPPGATRYFSFHVPARRPVGWGAAAGAERVSCQLLQGDGRAVTPGMLAAATAAAGAPAVSSGPAAPAATGAATATADMLQLAELEAGDYLLALTAPPDAAPLRVRPVVVGLELPDTGPPPEIIRQYLQAAGAVAVPAAAPGSHP